MPGRFLFERGKNGNLPSKLARILKFALYFQYSTKVVKIENPENGKYHVLFEDTILFPEGGGQNTDHGLIVKGDTKLEVKNIFRREREAVHEINMDQIPLKVGDEVVQIVDWDRRHDHMQQHSGQHLISAIFEQEYKYNTKSWWLGDQMSYIELDANDLMEEEIAKVEKICNENISKAVPVQVEVYEQNDPNMSETVTRASKGLPKDWTGPIRVINIKGVDANMCCGTHVSNLAQLQMVKLLNVEKRKGKIFLNFLVGNRVLKKLDECYNRELSFNQLLNGGPTDHENLVKKIKTNLQATQKTVSRVSKEMAATEAARVSNIEDQDYCIIHRADGLDATFTQIFLKSLKLKNKKMMVIVVLNDSVDSATGNITVQGDSADLEKLKDKICEILNGKGNGKGEKFQAKVGNLNKMKEVTKLVDAYFKGKKEE